MALSPVERIGSNEKLSENKINCMAHRTENTDRRTRDRICHYRSNEVRPTNVAAV